MYSKLSTAEQETKQKQLQDALTQLNWLQKLLNAMKPTGLQPLVQRRVQMVLDDMKARGIPMRVVEGYRSEARQNELYAQGRTKTGQIVTNARGGESYHNYGCAADLCFVKEGYNAPDSMWKIYALVAQSHGLEAGYFWTGGFVDKPHIEMKLGYKLSDFQQGNVDYSLYR